MLSTRCCALVALTCFSFVACASSDATPTYTSTPPDAGPDDDTGTPDGNDTPDTIGSDTSTFDVQPGDSDNPVDDTLLYAHDRDTLYTVDPKDPTLAMTTVGKFDCIGDNGEPSMTDLAIDKDGKLYGVASHAIFLDMQVDPIGKVVYCEAGKVPIDPGTTGNDAPFYGLTFAPPTQALGTSETLIGANTVGELYAIDTTDGTLTLVGKFGSVPSNDGSGHAYDPAHVGQAWALSGDMVFMSNEGSPVGFATLRDCEDPEQAPSNCSTVDTLVEIDIAKLAPAGAGGAPVVTLEIRGKVLPAGCADETCGFGSMYGIAAYQDKVFGFAYGGKIVSIDNETGEATPISSPLTMPGFAGAGVTTAVRVIPPQPK